MDSRQKVSSRINAITTRLEELEEEKLSLLRELSELKKHRNTKFYGQTIREEPPQTKEEKINLFLELFGCRTDIFPKMWENRNKGTKGYSPACLNEWKNGICFKPKTKCSDCINKSFITLDTEVIKAHLTGIITVGTYAIRKDDSCTFLAADFDKTGWEEDVISFKEAGARLGVPVYVERSRSGNGAHAWIFFAGSIQAYKARQLGTVILTETLKETSSLSLESYDRFFPNQDYLPKGGFGNLIALPLQHTPREKGNSVFIDDSLKPYDSQWDLLAGALRLSIEDVEEILTTIYSRVTDLRLYDSEDMRIKEAENGLNIDFDELDNCYPKRVTLHLGAMINLDVSNMPPKLILTLKRI